MSDTSAATIFGKLFRELAKQPDDRNSKLAKKAAKWMKDYDFHPEDMECNKELRKLGIPVEDADDD